jgi:hypothetical protein
MSQVHPILCLQRVRKVRDMPSMRALGGIALVTLALAACDSATPKTSPIGLTPGTREEQLRQLQLQGATSGANPGVQNPVATGRDVGGIVRQGTGTGSTAAGVGGMNPDGTLIRPGVGAPPTR